MHAGKFNMGKRHAAPNRTQRPIEHPCWHFQKSARGSAGKAATENSVALREHLMNMNEQPKPGMPRYKSSRTSIPWVFR